MGGDDAKLLCSFGIKKGFDGGFDLRFVADTQFVFTLDDGQRQVNEAVGAVDKQQANIALADASYAALFAQVEKAMNFMALLFVIVVLQW